MHTFRLCTPNIQLSVVSAWLMFHIQSENVDSIKLTRERVMCKIQMKKVQTKSKKERQSKAFVNLYSLSRFYYNFLIWHISADSVGNTHNLGFSNGILENYARIKFTLDFIQIGNNTGANNITVKLYAALLLRLRTKYVAQPHAT